MKQTSELIEPFLRDTALAGHEGREEDLAALASICDTLTLDVGEQWAPPAKGEAIACLLMSGLLVLWRHAKAEPVALASGSGFALRARGLADEQVSLTAAQNSTVLLIREAAYAALTTSQLPPFDQLLTSVDPAGIDTAEEKPKRDPAERGRTRLMNIPVTEVMTAPPVSVSRDTLIREAATLMRLKRISCLPIAENEKLFGVLTEADMTGRVVATGRSADDAVASVMSTNPYTVGETDTLFDVLRLFIRHSIAHLPVMDGHRLTGIITQTDIVRRQTASAVYLVSDVARRTDVSAIARDTRQIPRLLQNLVDAGANADEVGRTISSVTDAVTERLITLAEDELGPAPIPWLWLACGSQGRQEQTGITDQDNCLILSDDYDEDEHGPWFTTFAKRVCDGLDETGYVYCPGDMMAMNPRWCQPAKVWRRYFRQWIDKPGTEAQMLASVMFDLRPIVGDTTLFEPLQREVLDLAAANSIFVAHMVSNSLKHRPPLGLFGRLATERRGPFRHRIDLKHGGVVPIIDLARVYALSSGNCEVNTLARLKDGAESGVLSPSGARDLVEAYEFIASTRLRHQTAQIKSGVSPDNYLDPEDLAPLERDHLRDSMAVVRDIQSALSGRHGSIG